MRTAILFRVHGTWVYLVQEKIGELDLETGLRSKAYRYERVKALIGKKNFGYSLHINMDESIIVLPKQADLVVVDNEAFRLTQVSSAYGVYFYKKDKVLSDEFRSIVDGIPSKSDDETFS